MDTLTIEESLGKHLRKERIDFMVHQRIREYGENTKDFDKNERESLFFFLTEGEEIHAFGMLKPVTLYYGSQEYPIMGLGNVMAIEKSQGYGTILMNHIRTYLEKHRYIGLGNTHKDNFTFYTKCGFTVIPGFVERFVHIEKDGRNREPHKDWSDYAMFLYDGENILTEMIHGTDDIIIRIPLW